VSAVYLQQFPSYSNHNCKKSSFLRTPAHLTITISEIERDIGRKSSFFHTPLHSTPPLGGSRRNSATPFGTEKLEWLSYPMVKHFEDIFIRFGATHERDTHTDTACWHIPRLCIASRGKKPHDLCTFSSRAQCYSVLDGQMSRVNDRKSTRDKPYTVYEITNRPCTATSA